jgi:hypothetical protein
MYMKVVASLLTLVGIVIAIELGMLARLAARPRPSIVPAVWASVPLENQSEPADLLLDRVVPTIDIPPMPFEASIREFERQSKIEVYIKPEALTETQLQARVTARVHDVSIADALSAIVSQVSPKLPFSARGGVIAIGDAGELETRLYDVRSIMTWSYPPPLGPITDKDRPGGSDDLINLIITFVSSDTWRENGGTGSIQYWGGILLINQTPERHREIAHLLAKLSQGKLQGAVAPRAER